MRACLEQGLRTVFFGDGYFGSAFFDNALQLLFSFCRGQMKLLSFHTHNGRAGMYKYW